MTQRVYQRHPDRRALLSGAAAAFGATAASAAAQGRKDRTPRMLDLRRFRMTFEDRFETLDISAWGPGTRWIAHTPWNGDFGDAAFADPEPGFPFTLTPHGLRIEARQFPDGRWRTGHLSSRPRQGFGVTDLGFIQSYGYFEMRARLPDGPGVWPSFWMVTNGIRPSIEIDTLEYYGHERGEYQVAMHLREGGTALRSFVHSIPVRPGSMNDRFNTFGVLVDPQWVVYYHNREEVWRIPALPECAAPFSLMATLALGSGWPIDQLTSPQFMDIAYIRAYQHEDRL